MTERFSSLRLFMLGALLFAIADPNVGAAQAADGFSSDRPGYSNSTSTAPRLRAITEFGVSATIDEDDPETISAPNLRIRFGLADHVELRLDVPGVTGVIAPGPNDVTFGDTTFGLKVGFAPNDVFSSSFVGSFSFDTDGGGGMTGRLEWNWAIALGIASISGNLAGGTSPGGTVVGEGSVNLGINVSDRAGVYGQFFLVMPEDVDPMPYVGAGVYAQVAPRFQVDGYLDIGLTDATTRVTIGAGMTVLVGEGDEEPARPSPPPASQLPAQDPNY